MIPEPQLIDKRALLLLHEESLARFGGARGIRDEGLLDSALARPLNQYLYDKASDLASLAAAYAYGVIKNHALLDGNKRLSLLCIGLFLSINGVRFTTSQVSMVHTVLSLAEGRVDEQALAVWIRSAAI